MSLNATGQQKDNVVIIELSATTFSIERPFTISVMVENSENRPSIIFPDITGLTKRGTSTSISTTGAGGTTTPVQIITQTYVANQPGTVQLVPFSITVNGVTARSEGAVLMVRPASVTTFGGNEGAPVRGLTESGAAFLTLRTSKKSVFVGEGFALRLSLFVSDSYPFELRFDGVDTQLQAVLKQLRPTNTWEEDAGIRELKGQPVVVNNRKFMEYVIFQGVYFPLSDGSIQLPSVGLTLVRVQQTPRQTEPVTTSATAPAATTASSTIGSASAKPPASPKSLAQTTATEVIERVSFQARSISVSVRPLPSHPLRGRVAVGVYRLVESIDRTVMPAGKSTRYSARIEGEGNVASLQAPLWSGGSSTTTLNPPSPATETGLETLPIKTSQQIDRTGEQISGSKTFSYFLVPRRGGKMDLATVFGFVYFNLQTAQYDTLKSRLSLQVGDADPLGTSALNT
ncbi:MAG: BatD family protein, partial [Rudanella sp.]|nr:BatD family protein [Rudanella sp.]